MNVFRTWYAESKDNDKSGISDVEIFFFYISIVTVIIFSLVVLISNFQNKLSVLLFPLPIWLFLRSSRKDMSATANWIAAIFAAIGGAIGASLSQFINR